MAFMFSLLWETMAVADSPLVGYPFMKATDDYNQVVARLYSPGRNNRKANIEDPEYLNHATESVTGVDFTGAS